MVVWEVPDGFGEFGLWLVVWFVVCWVYELVVYGCDLFVGLRLCVCVDL